jgi:hypothetical protein
MRFRRGSQAFDLRADKKKRFVLSTRNAAWLKNVRLTIIPPCKRKSRERNIPYFAGQQRSAALLRTYLIKRFLPLLKTHGTGLQSYHLVYGPCCASGIFEKPFLADGVQQGTVVFAHDQDGPAMRTPRVPTLKKEA